jgi:hypothetical protein
MVEPAVFQGIDRLRYLGGKRSVDHALSEELLPDREILRQVRQEHHRNRQYGLGNRADRTGKPTRMIEEPTEIQTRILKAFGHAVTMGGVLQKTGY